ncbi:hypothetical protein NN561_006771 [Cricetulus griseus]
MEHSRRSSAERNRAERRGAERGRGSRARGRGPRMRGRPEAQAREGQRDVGGANGTPRPAPPALDYDCACAARGAWTFLEPGGNLWFPMSGDTLRFRPQKRRLWAQRPLRIPLTQLRQPTPAPATLEGGSWNHPGLRHARFSAQYCPRRQLSSPNHCNPSVAILD